ncbi:MAG: alpha/beta fold hydrolase [Dehalococcoidia bacterium]
MALEQRRQERRPLWSELLAGLEWLALKASPVYYGIGAPRGDGVPVVLVPGFLGTDRSLLEMHLWLGRMGYRSYLSGIGRVADCPDVLLERLLETVDRAHRETGKKVRIIGHSLGGLLARAAAVRAPHQIDQVVTMASPFRRLAAHPSVLALIGLVRNRALVRRFSEAEGSCECSFLDALREPMPASVTRAAIYTKGDPVVDWRDCAETDGTLNIEVSGTHVGLVFNSQVFRELAQLLAEPLPVQKPNRAVPQRVSGLKRASLKRAA